MRGQQHGGREMDSPAPGTIEYEIDGRGVLTSVSESWTLFAVENGAHHLVADEVLGQPLLSFISDLETRYLYQTIFDRLRATGIPVLLAFRCDSPDLRRFLELTISLRAEATIHLRSHTVQLECRQAAPLLDPKALRSPDYLTMCSWCKRVLLSEMRWVEVEDAVTQLELFSRQVLPRLSHGMCPACFTAVLNEIQTKYVPRVKARSTPPP